MCQYFPTYKWIQKRMCQYYFSTCQNNFPTCQNCFPLAKIIFPPSSEFRKKTCQNYFSTCQNNFPTCQNNCSTCQNNFLTCLINFPTYKWIQKIQKKTWPTDAGSRMTFNFPTFKYKWMNSEIQKIQKKRDPLTQGPKWPFRCLDWFYRWCWLYWFFWVRLNSMLAGDASSPKDLLSFDFVFLKVLALQQLAVVVGVALLVA